MILNYGNMRNKCGVLHPPAGDKFPPGAHGGRGCGMTIFDGDRNGEKVAFDGGGSNMLPSGVGRQVARRGTAGAPITTPVRVKVSTLT